MLLKDQRRERDSNPRYPFEVYTLSRRAPSTTRTPLLFKNSRAEITNFIKAKKIFLLVTVFLTYNPEKSTLMNGWISVRDEWDVCLSRSTVRSPGENHDKYPRLAASVFVSLLQIVNDSEEQEYPHKTPAFFARQYNHCIDCFGYNPVVCEPFAADFRGTDREKP